MWLNPELRNCPSGVQGGRAEMGELYVGALIPPTPITWPTCYGERWALWMSYQFLQSLNGMYVLQYDAIVQPEDNSITKCLLRLALQAPSSQGPWIFMPRFPGLWQGGGCSGWRQTRQVLRQLDCETVLKLLERRLRWSRFLKLLYVPLTLLFTQCFSFRKEICGVQPSLVFEWAMFRVVGG